MIDFKDKKIAVLGFGVEGDSVVRFLHGKNAKIIVFDEKSEDEFDSSLISEYKKQGVEFKFGEIKNLNEFDVILRSPGIKLSHPVLLEAKEKGAEVTTPTKIFFESCPCPIIGVTGTKGKGTTSTLIYEMLKKQGLDAYLGGNIGLPPLEFIDKLSPTSLVVLELSSFQLQDMSQSPHIAVMLMITSEHLDYHKDVYEYVQAKRNILRFQTKNDYAIVNKDYPASNESDIRTEAKIYKVSREQDVEQGCFVRDSAIFLKMSGHEEKIMDVKDIALPGRHNLENVCAAIVAAIFGGAKMKAIIQVAKSFKGLEHRLELVRTVGGVRYYNDSFSTTPETAVAAVEAFSEPKIVILGGSSKGSDFKRLGEVLADPKNNVKAIIGIGVEWPRIKLKVESSKFKVVEGLKTMHEIVQVASKEAELGDIVVLSPACASFDMFKNYKERGLQFKKEVNSL